MSDVADRTGTKGNGAGRYRVAMDIGGTFTDVVVVDSAEDSTISGKVSSTPANPAEGVLEGLRQFVPEPTEIGFIVHGTTVGLNAFLERKGTRTLLLMTGGVSAVYTVARGDRVELYRLQYRKAERLVPARDVLEVTERLRWDGSVDTPLDESSLGPVIEKVKAENVEAVAVCLLFSYVNPEHELRVREILQDACPGLSVTLSHEIAREWREYERASSSVMNAYIAPKVEQYLSTLEGDFDRMAVRTTLHVMQSNGGITTARKARQQPIQTLLSGPVGGTIGGAALSRATGRPNLLCVDMGGTSFDLSLIVGGRPSISTETFLQGLPVLMPLVDIHTIGAGGGSLAWLEGGGLRVGPQSAGALPGPACYGRGGTEPTVTDANLFLGRLATGYFLAGAMKLDEAAAQKALRSIASKLDLSDVAFAEGMLAIVNSTMADAMRTVTVKQGIDPRDYSLVAFGGAAAMHAVWLAEELEIGEVIVPWSPGTFSAWGMLQTDMRHDLSALYYHPFQEVDAEGVAGVYRTMEEEGRELLLGEHVPADDMYFARSADMRYIGQEYAVNVPVPAELDLEQTEAAFHDAHLVRYGHSTPGAPVEFVSLRVAALGRIEAGTVPYRPPAGGEDPSLGSREVVFEGERRTTPVLHRPRLVPGARHDGPVVIEEDSSTTVVPPGYSVAVDELGNLLIAKT
jgi:N-methylhydantoinase A